MKTPDLELFCLLGAACVGYLLACGGGYTTSTYAPGPSDPGFEQVRALVDKDCGGCHTPGRGLPVFSSGAAFRGSRAKARLVAGTMPPAPAQLSAVDKSALLDYLR